MEHMLSTCCNIRLLWQYFINKILVLLQKEFLVCILPRFHLEQYIKVHRPDKASFPLFT